MRRTDGGDGNLRREFDRVTIDARADTREGNPLKSIGRGYFQRAPITGPEEFGFAPGTAMPDRAHCVYDVPGG